MRRLWFLLAVLVISGSGEEQAPKVNTIDSGRVTEPVEVADEDLNILDQTKDNDDALITLVEVEDEDLNILDQTKDNDLACPQEQISMRNAPCNADDECGEGTCYHKNKNRNTTKSEYGLCCIDGPFLLLAVARCPKGLHNTMDYPCGLGMVICPDDSWCYSDKDYFGRCCSEKEPSSVALDPRFVFPAFPKFPALKFPALKFPEFPAFGKPFGSGFGFPPIGGGAGSGASSTAQASSGSGSSGAGARSSSQASSFASGGAGSTGSRSQASSKASSGSGFSGSGASATASSSASGRQPACIPETSAWSTCSATCGGGIRRRRVTFLQPSGGSRSTASSQSSAGSFGRSSSRSHSRSSSRSSSSSSSSSSRSRSSSRSSSHSGFGRSRFGHSHGHGHHGHGRFGRSISHSHASSHAGSGFGGFGGFGSGSRASSQSSAGGGFGGSGSSAQASSSSFSGGGGAVRCQPPREEEEKCNIHTCPVHCKVAAAVFSECSVTCGVGFQTKSSAIIEQSSHGGLPCPPPADLESRVECVMPPCPVDCEVAAAVLSECSVTCGVGFRTKSSAIIQQSQGGGRPCPPPPDLVSRVECVMPHCPVDCKVAAAVFSECSASCGVGFQTKSSAIVEQSSHGGLRCPPPADLVSRVECVMPPCPVHCKVAAAVFSECSVTCGVGFKTKSSAVIEQSQHGGLPCPPPAELESRVECRMPACAVHCELGAEVESECSVTCGVGFRTRARAIVREAKHGGRPCPPLPELRASVECIMPACPPPVHCAIEWSDYGPCAPCGHGTKTRTATIVRLSQNGGAPCPHPSELTETVTCFERPCLDIIDCQYIVGSWSHCSATCGESYRVRSVYIISQPINGGEPCPTELYHQDPCNVPSCPVRQDCEVDFGRWSHCSRSCDGGTQTTSGEIITQARNGGAACPLPGDLSVTRSCGNTRCPSLDFRECVLIQGALSECSVTCGGGYAYSTAWIKTDGANGGQPCPPPNLLTTTVECNSHPCPPPHDCEVRRSYWGECSRSCGGGIQTRAIEILRRAENGGLPCPTRDHDSRSCNSKPCPHGSGHTFAGASSQSFGGSGGSGSHAHAGAFGRGRFGR